MRRRRATIAILLAAAALTGCSSLGAPSSTPTTARTTTTSHLVRAQATHEYHAPAPPPEQANTTADAPVAAIRAFATGYINWRADTVVARMRVLAAQSVGQARSTVQLAAAGATGDYELRRGGIANSGTVEAIAPLTGRPGTYVVVTLERTTATATTAYQGLRPAWHLALATAVRLATGHWAVSRWEPEN
jgi:ABC-type glycerol-3-phosphate transport system substrate-binding protein